MRAGWAAGLLALAWSQLAGAQAVPLVPIDAPDSGPAAAPPRVSVPTDAGAPTPPQVLIIRIDAGAPEPLDAGAQPPAVPLVTPPPELDAGLPPEPDAGVPEAPPQQTTIVIIADAGAPQPEAGGSPAAPDAGPALAAAPDAGKPPERPSENAAFVKGELSELLGANRIAVQTTRVGVDIGVSRISGIIYALLEPRLDLHLGDFGLGLAAPLNLELYDTHVDPNAKGALKFIGTRNAGSFRKEDYQSPRDYARLLQYLTYGHKEDHLYVDVGQIYAHSIGHGEIMRRYQPDIDLDVVRIAAEVDAYDDYGGAELLTNDLLSANLLGGLVFVKPLSFVSEDAMARSLSIGFTYAADRTAPSALNINHGFPGSGLNGCDCRPVLVKDGSRFVLDAQRHPVSLLGLDAELKVFKTDDLDIKPDVDFSHLMNGDSGFTLGVLGRFNFGGSPLTPTQALRLVLEGRALGDRYVPEYFDTFYEVDKYIYLARPQPAGSAPITKEQAVLQGFGSRVGYYAEASYGIRGWIGATVALEGDTGGPAKNLVIHAELPKLFVIQFFGSYYKRGFTSFSTLGQLDQDSVALAGARVELLPILYINARAYQTFQLDAEDTHVYQTTRGIEGDVELGWQF